MFRERSIIHLNVADFAVAVERVVDPRLKNRPVLVAAAGASRAAVYDMSDEAFQAGVRKGMALRRAQKLCREARVVPPHPHHYERAMRDFLKLTCPYSPLIEAGEDNGHLFVDATGTGRLHGPPPDVAWRIRRAVQTVLSLDPIWSVAPNKLLAKVATRVVKPTGEYILEPGEEEEFLRPLPLFLLPGLEREDLLAFHELNVTRVGQAAPWSPEHLAVVFGRRGGFVYRTLRGVDQSPVLPLGQEPPALRLDWEFSDDTNDRAVVEAALFRLVEKAGRALRRRGRAARRLILTLDYSDGVRIFRQRADPAGTAGDFKLFLLAREALDLAWFRRVRLRHLRLVCDRLVYPAGQLELFPEEHHRPRLPERLLPALDLIRKRFGAAAVSFGRTLAAA
ncbi:MAG: hypothetical protein AB1896_09140 [Thermodesulfobacteriota bacterium]